MKHFRSFDIDQPLVELPQVRSTKTTENTGDIDKLFHDWHQKFSSFNLNKTQRNLLIEHVESSLNNKNGWHIKLINSLFKISSPFSYFHFVSFMMNRMHIPADNSLYTALSENKFFQKFNIKSQKFGVSKYNPSYFSAFIQDSSSFNEALCRTDFVIKTYCYPTYILFDALSTKVSCDQHVFEIFDHFSDLIISPDKQLLSENFFFNIGTYISNVENLIRVSDNIHIRKVPSDVFLRFSSFSSYPNRYGDIVELLSRRQLTIDESELAQWVSASHSFDEALSRVRIAFRNNPHGYELFSSSAGDWVTTSEDFITLKELDEELKGPTKRL